MNQKHFVSQAEIQLELQVDEFSIQLQKSQFDSLARLMELFSEYSLFQGNYVQTKKYKYLRPAEYVQVNSP